MDEQDSVFIGEDSELFVKFRRWHQIATLALYRLNDDCRDFLSGQNRLEKLFLDRFYTFDFACVGLLAVRAAITVGIRNVVDRQKGPKTAALNGFTAG